MVYIHNAYAYTHTHTHIHTYSMPNTSFGRHKTTHKHHLSSLYNYDVQWPNITVPDSFLVHQSAKYYFTGKVQKTIMYIYWIYMVN